MAPSFLLLYVITNEKTLKLSQIDWLLAASKIFPQKHVPTTLVDIPGTTLVGIPFITPETDIINTELLIYFSFAGKIILNFFPLWFS